MGARSVSRPGIEDVVCRVAAGEYADLKRDGIDSYPDGDLSLWAREYGDGGATVVPLADEAWDTVQAIPIENEPGTWFVVVDLWTVEESRSDLFEATVREARERIDITIDNLHVL